MAKEIIVTHFVSELTPEAYLAGFRSTHDHINKLAESNAIKKYYKKNGKPRKNHPPYLPLHNSISIQDSK